MWNRRREEDYPPARPSAPSSPASATEPVIKEGSMSMSSTPSRVYEPETPRSAAAATIGKSVVIKGQIFSREDLYVDGEVDGTIECPDSKVTVGPHGRLTAGIKAREVVVLGSVQGKVEASEKIDIRKDARQVGDITTARIVIEDGAYFKGSIDITRSESPRPPEKPQKQQQQAAAAQQQQPTAAAPSATTAAPAAGAGDNRR